MLNILPKPEGVLILTEAQSIYSICQSAASWSAVSQALRAAFSQLAHAALVRTHARYMHCAHACMACAHVSCCCQLLFSDSLLYLYESVYILDLFAIETTSPQPKRKRLSLTRSRCEKLPQNERFELSSSPVGRQFHLQYLTGCTFNITMNY